MSRRSLVVKVHDRGTRNHIVSGNLRKDGCLVCVDVGMVERIPWCAYYDQQIVLCLAYAGGNTML